MYKSIFSAPHFNDEAAAYAYVEARIWADSRVCPKCGVVDRSAPLQGKSTRPGLYKCYACRQPFTVKIGTIFEASHIQLRDWLTAMHLICSSKKGISANQLHRTLGITLKSAWFMAHRIRLAMDPGDAAAPIGGKGKIVEADETFLSKSVKTRRKPGQPRPVAVLSLVERDGGPIRSRKLNSTQKHEIGAHIRANVDPASVLHTDGAQHYEFMLGVAGHEAVNHNKEYVRITDQGVKVHTNTLEGFFSVFKRGLVGTYQHISEKHTHRYLAEFDFRQNNRVKLGVNDADRTAKAVKGIVGKRLTYRTTNRETASA